MAVTPVFVIGPSMVMALIGHIRGPRPVREPDLEAIRELEIDVVIPAYNEAETIALCLAALMRQTIKPNSVTVIDDGSQDDTAAIAEAFAAANNFAVEVIRRRRSIGKTPGLKIQSRKLEGDVEFILDADTLLESEDYIEKVVAQLYRVPGIASACGLVYPLRDVDRARIAGFNTMQHLQERRPDLDFSRQRPLLNRMAKAISIFHRDAIFQFNQVFYYSGVQCLFGSLPSPIGCAVAYRRDYLKEMFDRYEPKMGDNLTTSEDIFLGNAMMAAGYHNTQTLAVVARSDVPELQHIPRQLMNWSSAWLQTGLHLPDMLKSPFRSLRRYRHRQRNREMAQKRRVVDGYRQPFGVQFARQLGRPSGWMMFVGLIEKIAFTLVILLLMLLGAWWWLALTILIESLLFTFVLMVFSSSRRFEYAVKAISAAPFRYALLAVEVAVLLRFVFDVATGRQGWRK